MSFSGFQVIKNVILHAGLVFFLTIFFMYIESSINQTFGQYPKIQKLK